MWQLLLPIGRRISIETLEGQVLAVDASIWLTQFLKAMRDPETGKVQPAAHLKGFFRRLCRLLYHNIRPVFVFDGATPEVKATELALRRRRREQFAHASQDTMQRLAKKLLHQKLLKEKIMIANQGNTAAFERGFNPGDNVQHQTQTSSDESKTTAPAEDMDRKLPAINMAVDVGIENDQVEDKEDSVNDWDDPGMTQQQQLLRLGLYDSDDDDSDYEQPKDDDTYDMSFLAKLPPNRRKDAIEKAQRQHRILARKEHMPAAGDPFAFSQVQMANFLKSSRLNKNIQTSLAQAVKHDNSGGDVMASDATMRLELIREDETLPNKRLARKRNREESESEEEPEWESPTVRRQVVTGTSLGKTNGRNEEWIRRSQRKSMSMFQIEDSDEDSCIEKEPVVSSRGERALVIDANEKLHDPIIVDSDNDSDEDGGFIREERGQVPTKDTQTQDSVTAQELQDRLLAEALQTVEEEEDAEAATQVHESGLHHTKESAKDCCSHSGDEESVDWEDGEVADDVQVKDSATELRVLTSGDVKERAVDMDDWSDDCVAEKDGSFDSDEDFAISHRTKRVKSSGRAADTTAALERAQKEAANLADWAGRVFRRAMKDAMVSGETATASSSTPILTEKRNIDREVAVSPRIALNLKSPSATALSPKTPSLSADSHQDLQVATESNAVSSSRRRMSFAKEKDDASRSDDLDRALKYVEQNDTMWAEERNKRERDMDSVTDEMKLEVMQLFQLFGVPYIEAPAEAEAQCAELERLGLVDGIITEDSDVFVFGGKAVYKNIFEDQKFEEAYKANDAEREMGLGRDQMVALAMLLGGDYTQGVKGVGIVNAMEVLNAFDFSGGAREGLQAFKKWLDGMDLPGAIDVHEADMHPKVKAFHEKHKSARRRWITPEGFPVENVLKAYSQPVVDSAKDVFSWGRPDPAGLIVFCSRNIGWSADETKALLGQVAERPRNGLRQTRLDAYMPMRYEDSITFANVRSKRLQEVLRKHKKNGDQVDES